MNNTHFGTLIRITKCLYFEGFSIICELQSPQGNDTIKIVDEREELRNLIYEQMEGMLSEKVLLTGTYIGIDDDKIPMITLFHISVLKDGKSFIDRLNEHALEVAATVPETFVLKVGNGWQALERWFVVMANALEASHKGSVEVVIEGWEEHVFKPVIVDDVATLEVDIELPSGLVRFESVEMRGKGMEALSKEGVTFHYFLPIEDEVTSGIPENEAAHIAIGHTMMGGGGTFRWDANAQHRLGPYLRGEVNPVPEEEHKRNLEKIREAVTKDIKCPPSTIEEALADAAVRGLQR